MADTNNDSRTDRTAQDTQRLARQAISRGVREIVEHTHGVSGFEPRPTFPGSEFVTSVPVGEAGIGAALMLRDRAVAELRDQINAARGRGMSWERVAEALGYAGEDTTGSPAERAFYLVAPHDGRSFRPSWTAWRCSACDRVVTDRGPFNGHPEDNEDGHAQGCARLAAEVAEYRRQRGEDT